MDKKKHKFGSLLLKYGLISFEDLEESLKTQKETGLKLGETLIKMGKITEDNIDWILSKQFEIPYVMVEQVTLDRDLVIKLPKEFLLENRILPLYASDDEICIVTDNLHNYSAFALLEKTFVKKVHISLGNGKKIDKILAKFFESEATPSLALEIRNILKKIKNTSFYRIDIIFKTYKCEFWVYGGGIVRKIASLDIFLKKEDVLKTFDTLQIPYLYNIHETPYKSFFSIYPLTNKISDLKYPAILGMSGLFLPEESTFADLQSSDIPSLHYSDTPVFGYPYFLTKEGNFNYNKIIYTLDSAPKDFKNYYVKTYAPQKCSHCESKGCNKCKQLGYIFKKIEGFYNSSDLNKILREDS